MLHLASLMLFGCKGKGDTCFTDFGAELDRDGDGTPCSTDPDDADGSIYPGAVDVCDGKDNDVDGEVDEDFDPDVGCVRGVLIGEISYDRAGHAVVPMGDVNGDGRVDLAVAAKATDRGGNNSGAVHLVVSPVFGSQQLSAAHAILVGDADDTAGSALAAGDLNADGHTDLIVGAPLSSRGGTNSGAVYAALGPFSGESALAGADAIFSGESATDGVGVAVAVGDVNGDGESDVIVGAPYADQGHVNGAVYVIHGPTGGEQSLSTADAKITGDDIGGDWGAGVAVTDLDQDGLADVVVGGPGSAVGASYGGAVFVFYGSTVGERSAADADAIWYGESVSDQAGTSVASAEDMDDDGQMDVVVGGDNAAYLVLGPFEGERSLATAHAVLDDGDEGSGLVGASAGDIDGDDHLDLVIGGVFSTESGARWVRGPAEGHLLLSQADAVLVRGVSEEAGTSVSGAIDMNGDGRLELVVGAPGMEWDGGFAGGVLLWDPLGF